jgi:hypothetical protein
MLEIRRATMADIPEITEIYNDAILKTVATFDTETKTGGHGLSTTARSTPSSSPLRTALSKDGLRFLPGLTVVLTRALSKILSTSAKSTGVTVSAKSSSKRLLKRGEKPGFTPSLPASRRRMM